MLVYLKFALAPTATPDASQWNIGGVGSSGVGHVYFMYISCCLCIIFRVGYAKISSRKGSFQWNMGFTFQSEVNMALSLKPKYRALFLTYVNAGGKGFSGPLAISFQCCHQEPLKSSLFLLSLSMSFIRLYRVFFF